MVGDRRSQRAHELRDLLGGNRMRQGDNHQRRRSMQRPVGWRVAASYAAAVSRRFYDLAYGIYDEIRVVLLNIMPAPLCDDLLRIL